MISIFTKKAGAGPQQDFSGKRKKRVQFSMYYVIKYIVFAIFVIYAVSLLMPFLWMLFNSVKPKGEFLSGNIFGLPSELTFGNYINILRYEIQGETVYEMFFTSVVLTLLGTFVNVFFSTITAYCVAKYKFPGRKIVMGVAIFTMIIPIVGSLSSSLSVRRALGIYDNLIPFLLTNSGGFGFNFILLYGAFKSISWSYAEAAFIDGAGHHTVMYRIFMPMMMPTLFALFVLAFVGGWNDYMTIITYLPSYPNLAYGIYMFNALSTVNQHSDPVVMAGFVLVAIPTVTIWCISQKFVSNKVVVGGLKG